MPKKREITKVEFQILSPPEGDNVVLEFLDQNDDAFMEVSIDANNRHLVTIYSSTEHLQIPLGDLERGIALAKEKVKNVNVDEIFGDEQDPS